MTLDEAIKHAEEVVRQNEDDVIIYSNFKNHRKNLYEIELAENAEKKCRKCAEEHRQLAEWLKELKQLREQTRWIPVSERLPEKNDIYVVWTSKGFGDHLSTSYYSTDYGWTIGVCAWKENEEPYKAESEE